LITSQFIISYNKKFVKTDKVQELNQIATKLMYIQLSPSILYRFRTSGPSLNLPEVLARMEQIPEAKVSFLFQLHGSQSFSIL
jgi:hypothetical protein